jgi:hypothetical protein
VRAGARHPGQYYIFNLCREREYPAILFEGNVRRIPVRSALS